MYKIKAVAFYITGWDGQCAWTFRDSIRFLPPAQLVPELLLPDPAASTWFLMCSLCCPSLGSHAAIIWFISFAAVLFLWGFWALCTRLAGLAMAVAFQIQQKDFQGGGCWRLVQLPLEARPRCFCGFAAGLEAHRVKRAIIVPKAFIL